jgi:hypothetical protein
VSEKGEEISQPGIDLGNSIVVVGKSEVVVGLPLSFPSAKAGKYRLLVETTNAGSAEAATAQTDIELVQ